MNFSMIEACCDLKPFPVEGVHLIEEQSLLFELVLQHILFRSLVKQDLLVLKPLVKPHPHLLPKKKRTLQTWTSIFNRFYHFQIFLCRFFLIFCYLIGFH